jgi:hypothetical protein
MIDLEEASEEGGLKAGKEAGGDRGKGRKEVLEGTRESGGMEPGGMEQEGRMPVFAVSK